MAGAGAALLRQCPLLLPLNREGTAYEGFVTAQVPGPARRLAGGRYCTSASPALADGPGAVRGKSASRLSRRRGRQLLGRVRSRRVGEAGNVGGPGRGTAGCSVPSGRCAGAATSRSRGFALLRDAELLLLSPVPCGLRLLCWQVFCQRNQCAGTLGLE